jgi:hypothetical protein
MNSSKPVVYYLEGHVSDLNDESFKPISWAFDFKGLTAEQIKQKKTLDRPLLLPVIVNGREDFDGEWLRLANECKKSPGN